MTHTWYTTRARLAQYQQYWLGYNYVHHSVGFIFTLIYLCYYLSFFVQEKDIFSDSSVCVNN